MEVEGLVAQTYPDASPMSLSMSILFRLGSRRPMDGARCR